MSAVSSASVPHSASSAALATSAPLEELSFDRDQRGLMSERTLDTCHRATFAVMPDDGGPVPVCCGFFISPQYGVTTYHSAMPKVGDRVKARSCPFDSPPEEHELTVAAVHEELDLVVLHSEAPRAEPFFFRLAEKGSLSLLGAENFHVGFAFMPPAFASKDFAAGSTLRECRVATVSASRHHFGYTDDFAVIDLAGVAVLAGGRVVGMHLCGWNHDVDPLDVPSAATSTASPSSSSSAVADSYRFVVNKIESGGCALNLTSVEVREALGRYL